ncbi:hypothetical protein SmJEL517_g01081 [Synchytrium microbalum]|uniref:NodB homology domain-containing protein n=1 Tax=Synchytrium microbalum TaxID=1806994 RepID=A0A507C5Q9_9FUNG|nr:uncharacterized protein SmJEL517_g01081 [Synchytrium microbalum]TPX36920.1 hypothetical protein SmJEL517_g01081 [Synchytrium microbalum]
MAVLNTFRMVVLSIMAVAGYLAFTSGGAKTRFGRQYSPNYPISCTSQYVVAWTFDEGPSSNTQNILYALRAMNVTATFHISTRYITQDLTLQSYVKALYNDGHVIGIRFNTILNPSNMSLADVQTELINESAVIYNVIGQYPKYLVMPYGQTTAAIDALTKSMGFITTSFALDTMDYVATTTSANIVSNVTNYMSQLVGGQSFIFLSHDLYSVTNVALNGTVNAIRAAGYKLVAMDKCQGSTAYRTSNGASTNTGSSSTGSGSSGSSSGSGLAGQTAGSGAHNLQVSFAGLVVAALFAAVMTSF